eukprot:660088-Pleurochrysis_carterae.AAC.3
MQLARSSTELCAKTARNRAARLWSAATGSAGCGSGTSVRAPVRVCLQVQEQLAKHIGTLLSPPSSIE